MERDDLATAAGAVVAPNRLLGVAAAASIVHAVAMIPGYNEDNDFDAAGWLIMLAISLVVSLAVFWKVVPGGGPTTALVLAIVGFLSIAAFWAMLTLPLATAAALTGARNRPAAKARAGLILGLVTVVALAVTIITDAA